MNAIVIGRLEGVNKALHISFAYSLCAIPKLASAVVSATEDRVLKEYADATIAVPLMETSRHLSIPS